MQPTLFSYVLELHPKIKFPCAVDGKELMATITHKEDDGLHSSYHVSFSDGYKATYLPNEPFMQEGFGRIRNLDVYEEAIYDDLGVVTASTGMRPLAYVRVGEVGGHSFNVWIREVNGVYQIFYKGCHQFSLRKTQRWEVSGTKTVGHIINHRMAQLISGYIDENLRDTNRRINKVA